MCSQMLSLIGKNEAIMLFGKKSYIKWDIKVKQIHKKALIILIFLYMLTPLKYTKNLKKYAKNIDFNYYFCYTLEVNWGISSAG